MNSQFPLARKGKLVVRELADEVLVYDLSRKKAFCLNRLAAGVWRLSDGQRSAAKIADDLSVEFGATIEEKVVWVAVDQLGRDHLLEYCIDPPSSVSGLTRREQLRSLGRAAAITGPIVAALAVPRAAAAASCLPKGAKCTPGLVPACCRMTDCHNVNPNTFQGTCS